ncbi:hypothetical protein EVG20_g10188 [Dentipellis fragilis]|uniref:Uncharacterized protein n=1 Tax=Dentipellis fragilis TaxID=205917 RepID=A0A4Y9XU48_9AGAM|nr:hypothetical protein EVG20_g10188 [Dentipellis fragilis]
MVLSFAQLVTHAPAPSRPHMPSHSCLHNVSCASSVACLLPPNVCPLSPPCAPFRTDPALRVLMPTTATLTVYLLCHLGYHLLTVALALPVHAIAITLPLHPGPPLAHTISTLVPHMHCCCRHCITRASAACHHCHTIALSHSRHHSRPQTCTLFYIL